MDRYTLRSALNAVCAAIALAAALLASPSAAIADPIERILSTPTNWVWYYGLTASQLQTVLNNGSYRIVDLQVESASSAGPVFTVVLVANSGVYAKGWWWYYGQSLAQVSAALSTNSARLISIAPYVQNGTTYFASVMVPNTGADAKGWYWWVGTASQISSDLANSGARMVDLEPFATGAGTANYVAIAIANTGADADSWWWYLGDSASGLQSHVTTNKAQLLTFNNEPATSTFDSVMQGGSTAPWYYYEGISTSSLQDLLAENGSRLTQARSNLASGTRTMNAIMIDNSTPCTTRVIGIQHANGTGWNGDYLEQITGGAIPGGTVLCNAADARPFDPAGASKTVIGTYAMSLVQQGQAKLSDRVPVLDPANVCNFQQTKTETLKQALTAMLQNGDDARADMLLQRYGGPAAMTSYAHQIGMANTNFNSYYGCAGSHNTMTLDDAATLYTDLSAHTLLNPGFTKQLFGIMSGRTSDVAGTWNDIQTIVGQVAPAALPQAQRASFIAAMTLTYDSGIHTYPTGVADLNGQTEYGDEGVDGVVGIPFCKATTPEMRHFAFGFFHQSTTSDADQTPVFNAMGAGAEMLREQLQKSLKAWANCG